MDKMVFTNIGEKKYYAVEAAGNHKVNIYKVTDGKNNLKFLRTFKISEFLSLRHEKYGNMRGNAIVMKLSKKTYLFIGRIAYIFSLPNEIDDLDVSLSPNNHKYPPHITTVNYDIYLLEVKRYFSQDEFENLYDQREVQDEYKLSLNYGKKNKWGVWMEKHSKPMKIIESLE